MILHPTIMALFVGSLLIGSMIVYAAVNAFQIIRSWDIKSGSELQLILERKTYLISTLLTYALGFELLSFFLYIYAADMLHVFFSGAMCAAGSLYVNSYGYPALLTKLAVSVLAGIWLVVNHVDGTAPDYPLIRKKYVFFMLLVPLVFLDMVLTVNYFLRLNPSVITSCCGTLFSTNAINLPFESVMVSNMKMMAIFYLSFLLTTISGLFFVSKSRGALLFSFLSGLFFIISVVSILVFISSYIYELPNHHCPFCLLQKEYHFIGYPLYLTLLGGTISGISIGVLKIFGGNNSLSVVLPAILRKLALAALCLYLIFIAIATACIVFSNLTMAA